MEKVLHIANWYPNLRNPYETPFVKKHFDAVSPFGIHKLWHIQVRYGDTLLRIYIGKYDDSQSFLIIDTSIKTWRLIELLHVLLLIWLRIKLGRKWWDVVNVHIAYPLLRYPRFFRMLFGKAIVITEHWSAYRKGFFLPPGSRSRKRIQKIFRWGIPIITVSRALMNDIIEFAETDAFPKYIVPNVVDPVLFHPVEKLSNHPGPVFLMVGAWAPIKRPLLIMQAFTKIIDKFPEAKLRIVGYGHQWDNMKAFVESGGFNKSISLLGPMEKNGIACEMQQADAFLHASEYETFSVVCAEALCCGTPVIASNVGGIKEFIDSSNGLLVENSVDSWADSLTDFIKHPKRWDIQLIAKKAEARFNPAVVGAQLSDALNRRHVKNGSNTCSFL